MKRWQTGSLMVRFTISFILHQFLLMLILALPGMLYLSFLQKTENQTMIALFSWMSVFLYLCYCVFYGYYFARPMYDVLNRIETLSKGTYIIPKQQRSWFSSRIYREVNTHLDSLSLALQESEKQRNEFEQLRQEWAAGVTHDLKTPLSYISGYTDMLLSDKHRWTEEESRAFLQKIKEQSKHMEELIADLNIAFRLDHSFDIKRNQKAIELVELLRRVIADVANAPSDKGNDFALIDCREPVYVNGDAKLFKRAFTNLLINAIEHNPPGTNITMSIQKKEQAEIRIEDNGRGMDSYTVQHLFDRYYRGTATQTPTEGTGLGMAIVQQIITAFEGSIEVKSKRGQGTTMIVKLPYSEALRD